MTHLSFHSLGLSVEAAYLMGAQKAVEGLSLGMHGLAKTRVEDGGPLFSEIQHRPLMTSLCMPLRQ